MIGRSNFSAEDENDNTYKIRVYKECPTKILNMFKCFICFIQHF